MDRAAFGAMIAAAVGRLGQAGFVAYPTETVWGLGACADQARGIDRLMAWKGRGSDAPLAVLVSSAAAAAGLGCDLRPPVHRLMKAFWPGPLMLVVPCQRSWAPGVARSDGALGLRCSPHPVASALVEALEAAGLGPLTSTSLNRSGASPARSLSEASNLLAPGDGPASIDSPWLVAAPDHDAGGSLPSTVVDCTRARPKVLRTGEIDAASIDRVWTEST